MKTKMRTSLAVVLGAILLFGCSGSGPSTGLDGSKDAAATQAPPAPAPPPAAAPAPVPEEKPIVKETTARPAVAKPRPAPPRVTTAKAAPAPTPANVPPVSGEPVPVPSPQASAPIPVPPPPQPVEPVLPPQPVTRQVTIPSGTQVFIRMIDSIDSETGHVGETFRASMAEPIVLDNETIVPKNADVFVKLVSVESAGKLSGTSQLQVQLDRIEVDKKFYEVVSNKYLQSGASQGEKAARNVGVGAAVGAVLGGILGGKKGAVIGAGAGGGGGAVLSNGEQVHIDSETQLVFRLDNPLEVTITRTPSVPTPVRRSPYDAAGPAKLAPPSRVNASPRNEPSRAATENNVSGTWNVTTDGPEAASYRLTLTQRGNDLQGSISGPLNGSVSIQGSVSGNFISFYSAPSGFSGTRMQFSGAIDGDTMRGTVTMTPTRNSGGYPGGGYPGGGYPGGNRRPGRAGANGGQIHWNAERAD
jgi:hypothetical protein